MEQQILERGAASWSTDVAPVPNAWLGRSLDLIGSGSIGTFP